MIRIISFALIMCLISVVSYAFTPLSGTGYGKTREEAKQEAIADLVSIIKVQVYSKFEITETSKNNDDVLVRTSKFVRLISGAPIINPDIIYTKDQKTGGYKAVVSINTPIHYVQKLNDLTKKINNLVVYDDNRSSTAIYRRLVTAMPLYEEFESYDVIAKIIGAEGYNRPVMEGSVVRARLLDMKSEPPTLEVAADVIAEPFENKKGVYVDVPLTPGSEEATPFGLFFRDLIISKLKFPTANISNANSRLDCSYSEAEDGVIMVCSLVTGSMITESSIVKIPRLLLSGQISKPKTGKLTEIVNSYKNNSKSSFYANVKITSEGGETKILKTGDICTLLVKVSEPSYIYLVGYSSLADGKFANVISIGKKQEIIKEIKEENVDRWHSIGQFVVADEIGTSTMQIFITKEKPDVAAILPPYAINNFGRLPAEPEKVAEDFMIRFSRLKGDKYVLSHTFSIVGGGK